jgi:hypothetical protein
VLRNGDWDIESCLLNEQGLRLLEVKSRAGGAESLAPWDVTRSWLHS